MSQSMTLIWVHALSPLRIGTEEGLGPVNLPTLREVHTGHPLVPGSSLKGVLRGLTASDNQQTVRLFGPDRNHASEHRGALRIGDARIVALPVRSLMGTFAWCTSPSVLRRVERDVKAVDPGFSLPRLPSEPAVATDSALLGGSEKERKGIFVEEIQMPEVRGTDAAKRVAEALAELVWKDHEADRAYFVGRFCLLPDEVFDALCRGAMEVRTRVCIDPSTGTAEESGPWSEEAMPAETLLLSLVEAVPPVGKDRGSHEGVQPKYADACRKVKADLEDLLKAGPMVCLGGHNSVGYGRAILQGPKGAK
jgi:CRISPR-associated protein Cmr4